MNILLVAEESAGMQMLRWLAKSPHHLTGVVTSPPRPGHNEVSLWRVAERMGVTTWPARSVTEGDFAETLRELEVDLLLNVHSLYLIAAEVLEAPRLGAFNLHPGPLPEYAGLYSASWTIYRGEEMHGVTVHHMDPGIDTGAIAYQTRFPLLANDTALSVNTRCVRFGLEMMAELVEDATAGAIPRIPQDPSKRRYFGREVPEDGLLRWSQPAEQIARFVRACDYLPFPSPWGHPTARLGDVSIGVARASLTGIPVDRGPGVVGNVTADGVLVAGSDQWVLVETVQIAGALVDARKVLQAGQRLDDGQRDVDRSWTVTKIREAR